MANRAYLCCSDSEVLYPSSTEADYDSHIQTVAMDAFAIPLFWLAAFRECDIVTQTIPDECGKPVSVSAPICSVARAVANLEGSVAGLERLFSDQKNLAGYVPYLIEAITRPERQWLTIELLEIEYMVDPEAFRQSLRLCLRGFDDPTLGHVAQAEPGIFGRLFGRSRRSQGDWRYHLLALSTLKPEVPFPEASMLRDCRSFTDDELWNFSRLLGDQWLQPVPWNEASPPATPEPVQGANSGDSPSLLLPPAPPAPPREFPAGLQHAESVSGPFWNRKHEIVIRYHISSTEAAPRCGAELFAQMCCEYANRKRFTEIEIHVTGAPDDMMLAYKAFRQASGAKPVVEKWLLAEVPRFELDFETPEGDLVRNYEYRTEKGQRMSSEMKPSGE